MRLFQALPLIAAVALAACGDDVDEGLTDEELAAEDVAPVIEDNGAMPQPGQYDIRLQLNEFDAPGMSEAAVAEAISEFEAGAEEGHSFCVTEEMTRERWLSEMTESDCTLSRFVADGNTLDGAMMCESDIGLNGRVDISGRTAEGGSNLRLTYTLPTAAGEGTVSMQVVAEQAGDCE
ncbi:DUF3617 domain-containing protein [Aurantiacibacter sp. D1-12]|uniref:DUF3617 domain-containing protein n=1 Tax=Aurantiacibacter sp. D1-12 TaxID=2993658 RepID=UPI00237C6056|nr:DUF3617 family protein [Aurantiacibacter sp. D1-12]MDE1467817.1 DUF3617 family protein [Aurantiacibacter sp. D1-12]